MERWLQRKLQPAGRRGRNVPRESFRLGKKLGGIEMSSAEVGRHGPEPGKSGFLAMPPRWSRQDSNLGAQGIGSRQSSGVAKRSQIEQQGNWIERPRHEIRGH